MQVMQSDWRQWTQIWWALLEIIKDAAFYETHPGRDKPRLNKGFALDAAMSSAPPSDVVNATTPSANARAATHDQGDRASTALRELSLSAVAIHVQRGHLGCAVFVEEEQQLLLCEDLPCDFFSSQQENPAPLQNADHDPDQMSADIAAKTTATVHGPAASVLESCEQQIARHFLDPRCCTDHLLLSVGTSR